ncbi:unnamed protein product, partial [Mesorhabditis spiculigera]
MKPVISNIKLPMSGRQLPIWPVSPVVKTSDSLGGEPLPIYTTTSTPVRSGMATISRLKLTEDVKGKEKKEDDKKAEKDADEKTDSRLPGTPVAALGTFHWNV